MPYWPNNTTMGRMVKSSTPSADVEFSVLRLSFEFTAVLCLSYHLIPQAPARPAIGVISAIFQTDGLGPLCAVSSRSIYLIECLLLADSRLLHRTTS